MTSSILSKTTQVFSSLALLVCLPLSASAFEPEPFELELEGFFYMGVGVKVIGTQTMTHRGGDRWRMELNARGPFIRLSERTDFLWRDGEIIAQEYRYELRAPFEREERRVRFQPDQNRIRSTLNGETSDFDYDPTWQDPMSYTLLLLRDVEQDNLEARYTVVSRNRVREYAFEAVHSNQVPSRAAIMSQVEPDRDTTYVIMDREHSLPSHLIRWDDGSIEHQIRTLSADVNGTTLDGFPHWPNPRRNHP